MKTCKKCGETKDHSEFNKKSANRDGLYTYCKPCSRADNAGYTRAWKQANPERLREYTRNARANNPHKRAVYAANGRARQLGISGILTVDEWRVVLDRANWKCLACGQSDDLSLDHIIPLGKGGPNAIDNIQVLCLTCNRSKGVGIEDYR